jgi:hypothetical protein
MVDVKVTCGPVEFKFSLSAHDCSLMEEQIDQVIDAIDLLLDRLSEIPQLAGALKSSDWDIESASASES